MPEKKPFEPNRVMIGAMMILVGIALSLTGIGLVIGLPVFVLGIMLFGFYYIKQKRESAERLDRAMGGRY